MPIMSVVDRSDARSSARVLALTAKRSIDGQLEGRTHRTELVNMLRLLNAYKAHGFGGYEYETRSPRGPEALTLMPTADRRVVDLRSAIEDALKVTYGEGDQDNAIDQIDVVIRCVALAQPPEEAARNLTIRFLDAFIDRLVAH
jgi:hypothetical protein